MPLFSPDFVGERLRQARKAQHLTQQELAARVGTVTDKSISHYEQGLDTPSPFTIDAFCRVLEQPRSFFFEPLLPTLEGTTPTFFRSRVTATKQARSLAEIHLQWLREITTYTHRYANLPKLRLPNSLNVKTPVEISEQQIEEMALYARAYWGLGSKPIPHLVNLLEAHGVIIARLNLGSEKLNALSSWSYPDNQPTILLNDDKNCLVLSRFDLAHELGHLLLHRGIKHTVFNTPEMFSLMEDQAHHFARAFLLHRDSFRKDAWVGNLDMLLHLKTKWVTSIGAMIYRLLDLGLISQAQSENLWRNYARRGWRNNEPFDDDWAPESPELFRQVFEMLIRARKLTKAQLQNELAFSPTVFEQLTHLPSGWLPRKDTPAPTPLKTIRFTPRGDDQDPGDDGPLQTRTADQTS